MSDLSPTQRAFADQIWYEIVELLHSDEALASIARGRLLLEPGVWKLRESLYVGVANYDTARSEQLEHVREELARIITLMSGPVILSGRRDGMNYPVVDDSSWSNAISDTSLNQGCDECGNTHGDAHSSTCKRGKA